MTSLKNGVAAVAEQIENGLHEFVGKTDALQGFKIMEVRIDLYPSACELWLDQSNCIENAAGRGKRLLFYFHAMETAKIIDGSGHVLDLSHGTGLELIKIFQRKSLKVPTACARCTIIPSVLSGWRH